MTAQILEFTAAFKHPRVRKVERLVDLLEQMLSDPATRAEHRFVDAMWVKLERSKP